jgi:hypothetical protein
MSNIVVRSDLPHTWDHIRAIRKKVGEALKDTDPGLCSATMMVVSELMENAVKYGEGVSAAPNISLALSMEPEKIVVSVRNGCGDTAAVEALARRIREIAEAPDKAALYMERLEQLLADPLDSGKLGLYRIAFEGEFDMQFDYADKVVSIVATRACV